MLQPDVKTQTLRTLRAGSVITICPVLALFVMTAIRCLFLQWYAPTIPSNSFQSVFSSNIVQAAYSFRVLSMSLHNVAM